MRYFDVRGHCPLCGSKDTHQHFSVSYQESNISQYIENAYGHRGGIPARYLSDGFYDLNTCNECGLIYQSCVPSGVLLERIYNPRFNSVLKERKSTGKTTSSMRYVESDARQVAKHLKKSKSQVVLDFGVGYGIYAYFLLEKGIDVYGTELNTEAAEVARSKGVKILAADELINMRYDFINTEQVLEHVINPKEIIDLLSKLLKSNGIFKISVPNANKIVLDQKLINYNIPEAFKASTPLQHINIFTDSCFEYIACKWGFRFRRPVQWDYKFPIYTFARTVKRRLVKDNGTAWFEKVN